MTLAVHDIGDGATLIDLHHQGRAEIIGVGVLELPEGGVALVDPGPEARLDALRAGLAAMGHALGDVRAILLTHIHLDHATATGAIVREALERRTPELHDPDGAAAPGSAAAHASRSAGRAPVVHVHSVGAPHMIDPSRLLASAGRIYGDAMATLWGDFLPVPQDAIRVVDEGDVLDLGGRRFEVAYVPGHAKHHVAYHEHRTGTAWVGDVGGIRIRGGPVLPVTPPPDIDVEAWRSSMNRVMAWNPKRIVATHFGSYENVGAHFDELAEGLDAWAGWVRDSLNDNGFADDRARAAAFADWVVGRLGPGVSEGRTGKYAVASGFTDSWWGLARYWRKRGVG